MSIVIRFSRHSFLKFSLLFSAALFIYPFALAAPARGQVKRVVIIKVDGLPNDMVDRFVGERN
ncbi:MAG: hypothetical protein H0X14_00365, partial [Acidobacteria bacterium]|nr:hypothetical protein [Acidobacteriota bacterium]